VNGWPDVDASVLGRVTGTADVFMALGTPLPEADRDSICRQLSTGSERFRAACRCTRWFNAALLAGGLLFAVAITAILLGLPTWVSVLFVTASLVVIIVPGVRILRIMRQVLTMAVGACAMLVGCSDRDD
jgi:hypothetical protein